MAITTTKSDKLKLDVFIPDAFEDFRGDIYSTWDSELYPKLNWRLDKFSHSKKDVLRGIHGDFNTWKLINCVHGKFYLIVVDNRPDSETYGVWDWFILSSKNRRQVLVPPGYGNGHLVLSKKCTFHYKLAFDGKYNDVDNQFTIKWNSTKLDKEKKKFYVNQVDPMIFTWPTKKPILFGRDK